MSDARTVTRSQDSCLKSPGRHQIEEVNLFLVEVTCLVSGSTFKIAIQDSPSPSGTNGTKKGQKDGVNDAAVTPLLAVMPLSAANNDTCGWLM